MKELGKPDLPPEIQDAIDRSDFVDATPLGDSRRPRPAPTNAALIAEVMARVDAATARPWRFSEMRRPPLTNTDYGDRDSNGNIFWGYSISGSDENGAAILPTLGCVHNFPTDIEANAALIAHAPTDLAELCRRLAEADAEVRTLKTERNSYRINATVYKDRNARLAAVAQHAKEMFEFNNKRTDRTKIFYQPLQDAIHALQPGDVKETG